jgi:DoxX-like family
VAQVAIFGVLCVAGAMKLTMPVRDISRMWPWTGLVPQHFLRFVGLVDLAGGIGILLPAITRVAPWLTVPAALGCTVLQMMAIGFHASRGEISLTSFNFFLLGLSAFVVWGRYKKVPILPRG